VPHAGPVVAATLSADPPCAADLGALVFAEAPAGSGTVAGLQLVSSNGLVAAAPVVIVGYSQALIVAESDQAPIQLRAVEPAIGGLELDVIGAFAADVSDPDAFVALAAP
jgi:hypothetical protein